MFCLLFKDGLTMVIGELMLRVIPRIWYWPLKMVARQNAFIVETVVVPEIDGIIGQDVGPARDVQSVVSEKIYILCDIIVKQQVLNQIRNGVSNADW